MGRGFWIALIVLGGASLSSFIISGRLANAGACDTVWDCSDSGTMFVVGIGLAIATFICAVIGTLRADRRRRGSGTR